LNNIYNIFKAGFHKRDGGRGLVLYVTGDVTDKMDGKPPTALLLSNSVFFDYKG
jgi:hypothetical protein